MRQWGDIGHLHDPVMDIVFDGDFMQADLDGTVVERVELNIAFGVPLDPYWIAFFERLPFLVIHRRVAIAQAAMGDRPSKTLQSDVDGEDPLLVSVVATPARAIHHP